ncbi:uncharacterized protein LOC135220294 [Macrobrachium nipponense]|uniref:uncharacterized protein LOC135220294 n=1 Tax=Macrobrachium nipponense TaxID=159736 RepID=UPI0030C8601A
MRPRAYIVLLVCLGLALAIPPSSSEESSSSSPSSSSSSSSRPSPPKNYPHPQDPSKVFMKRDFKGPEAAPHVDSYAVPVSDSYAVPVSDSYAAPAVDSYAAPPAGDNGYYYYYHPVEEVGYKHGDKECGMGKALLAPLILIDIFVGILAAEAIGLIPKLELPPIQIPALPALPGLPGLGDLSNLGLVKPEILDLAKPDLLGLNKPDILGKSDIDENYTLTDYVPWGAIGKLTTVMSEAMEKDDCSARLVCETGKYAEGYEMMLTMIEMFAPTVYQNKIKIFKDSALKRSNCKVYRCGYVDRNEL